MNNARLNVLLQYLKEEPDDPFNLYAIALEYLNHDEKQAKFYFDQLLEKHDNYLPTYYHAAKYYNHLGKNEEADHIYKKGIMLAQSSGNHHALRELKNAYNEFLYGENDE